MSAGAALIVNACAIVTLTPPVVTVKVRGPCVALFATVMLRVALVGLAIDLDTTVMPGPNEKVLAAEKLVFTPVTTRDMEEPAAAVFGRTELIRA
jgi:hypothetical protein